MSRGEVRPRGGKGVYRNLGRVAQTKTRRKEKDKTAHLLNSALIYEHSSTNKMQAECVSCSFVTCVRVCCNILSAIHGFVYV
jgi:hypothetical protein